jgi:hypothetical protein
MDLIFDENRPETCMQVGLDCRTCIQRSAASTARVCAGLTSLGVQQLFFQLYPSEGCSPMAPQFVAAYAETMSAALLVPRKAAAAA